MKLVWRKTPRGTVERSLTQAETEALCDTYGAGRTATKEQQDLVRDITGQMIEDSLWLQCSCHPDFPPLNTVVDKASGRHLRHLHQSGRHSPSCPLFRVKKNRHGYGNRTPGRSQTCFRTTGCVGLHHPEKRKW